MTSLASPDTEAFSEAKRAQAKASDPRLSTWVEANAGSGKTKVLIDRVARLLLQRTDDGRPATEPNSILCITYTKAAANEMLSRLFSTLGDWSTADDETLRRQLANLEGRLPAAYTQTELKQARALFARALETPGGLRIETIHAFCARILRRFPLEAGVSPGFSEIEEDEAERLWQAALETEIEHAADANPEAVSILARATGGLGALAALNALKSKRSDLVRFAASITGADDLGSRIRKAVSAPDESASDLLDRAMGAELPRSDIETAILELEGSARKQTDDRLLEGLQAALAETNPERAFDFYASAIGGSKQDFSDRSNPFTKAVPVAGMVVDLFNRDARKGDPEGREITRVKLVKAKLASINAAQRTLALLQIGLPIIERYTREKARRAALDFDDLIEKTRLLLTRSDAADWVLYKLDGGLSHMLLDEAQDTSPAQWSVINALVREFQAGLSRDRRADPRTQFVVGDPKQSIYSFQGADQERFIAERQAFIGREEPLALSENRAINTPEMAMSFRSCPQILRFVDEVRASIPLDGSSLDPLPPSEADLKPHQARRSNQEGRVELWPLEYPLPIEQTLSDWDAPTDHVPANAPRRRLAVRIARQLKDMIDHGETVWKEQADRTWKQAPVAPEDILILVRNRNDLFDALIDSLKQQGLPVAGADRLKLLSNIGVQDCLNLIRFALQPGDDLTLAEILRGPFCGLVDDDRHVFELAHPRSEATSLWQALQDHPHPQFAAAHAFCSELVGRRGQGAFDFLSWTLTARHSAGLSGWDRLVQRLGEPVRDPVRALLMGALGHDMSEPMSLQAFLSEVEGRNTTLKRELGEPDGAIRVMTVHGAKGLQAPIVILPDTTGPTRAGKTDVFFSDEGTPIYSPSKTLDCAASERLRDEAAAAAEKESRRLLYVAMTRAADRLIIAGAASGSSASGFASSSWYRWCEIAMHQLVPDADRDPDTPTVISFGPEPPRITDRANPVTAALHDAPAWLNVPASDPAPPVRLAAPSRLIADTTRVLAPFSPERNYALRRGRLIHALLQTLPDLPKAAWAETADRFLARDPDLSPPQRREIKAVTLATLADPAFEQIFAACGRNEAAIVGTLPAGQMVNGRVDRLIVTETEVLIIDFKTDRPAPRHDDDVGEAYLIQMAAYRAVLQSLYPEREVRCALVYTDGPRLIELQGHKMSESLNRVESRV